MDQLLPVTIVINIKFNLISFIQLGHSLSGYDKLCPVLLYHAISCNLVMMYVIYVSLHLVLTLTT